MYESMRLQSLLSTFRPGVASVEVRRDIYRVGLPRVWIGTRLRMSRPELELDGRRPVSLNRAKYEAAAAPVQEGRSIGISMGNFLRLGPIFRACSMQLASV
ncbi:hypothetical protein M407DRAFT_158496 [Tulasnella calospora MUT 4182]|uniref:Uncharacterized protein n=1 Tax=Tulasnella calospora MUT 4182 TaxID=1051891 RepID=A0A0C3M8T9_9AGAM|nr:hypothetical protein M407DRAFT_158496 [Tulasnella calospora MUT 4182]